MYQLTTALLAPSCRMSLAGFRAHDEEAPVCQLCDQPDLTFEEYERRVRSLVDQHRFAVQSVSGSRCRAEFSYTVGLSAHGLPELVVTGARAEAASTVLQHWGAYLLDTSLVLPGETLESGPWIMEAVEVEQPQEHLLMAARVYGERVRGLQLAWADTRGIWPWEPGHRARRAGQPLLGRRAPHYCKEHRPDRLDVPRSLP